MQLNDVQWAALRRRLLDEASKADLVAGQFPGESDCRVASAIRTAVDYFEKGRLGLIPPEWEGYWTEITRQQDPEWPAYVELHRKFYGRDPEPPR